MSLSSNSIPLSERWALAQSHGGQPGWEKRITFFVFMKAPGCTAMPHKNIAESEFVHLYSIWLLMVAVFCNICETEQYFSFDRRTASSIAFDDTLPVTV